MDPDDPSIVIMKPSGLDEPGILQRVGHYHLNYISLLVGLWYKTSHSSILVCGIVGILLIAGLPVVYIDGDDNLMMSGDPTYKLSKRRQTYMEMVKDTVIPVCIPSPCDIDIVAVLYTPRMERACPYLPKLAIQGSKEVEEGIHAVLGEE